MNLFLTVLSILPIAFVGWMFYTMARDHKKHKWVFTIIGVASFIIGNAIIGLFLAFRKSSFVSIVNPENQIFIFTAFSILGGLLISWSCHNFLAWRWSHE